LTLQGPAVRVGIVEDGAARIAGEEISAVDGVVELARPGPIAVARDGAAVEVTAAAGFRLDDAWAAAPLRRWP
jgi:hypothetical protein